MPNEPIPSLIVRNLLDANWNTQAGLIPEPLYLDVNDGTTPIRIDFSTVDYVVISIDTPAEQEQPIGTWVYGDRTTKVLLELYTSNSRQRLYNLKQEIRRIIHAAMHTLTDYQRIQYLSFNELTETAQRIWIGRILIDLVNNAVLLET